MYEAIKVALAMAVFMGLIALRFSVGHQLRFGVGARGW